MLSGFRLTDTNSWYCCAGHLGAIRAYRPRPQQLRPCLALGTCTASFISLFVSAAVEEFFSLYQNSRIWHINLQLWICLIWDSQPQKLPLKHPSGDPWERKHPSDSGLLLLKSASFLVMCRKAKTSTRGERSDTALCLFTRVIFHQRSDAS